MTKKRVAIVGGVAGGATCAALALLLNWQPRELVHLKPAGQGKYVCVSHFLKGCRGSRRPDATQAIEHDTGGLVRHNCPDFTGQRPARNVDGRGSVSGLPLVVLPNIDQRERPTGSHPVYQLGSGNFLDLFGRIFRRKRRLLLRGLKLGSA